MKIGISLLCVFALFIASNRFLEKKTLFSPPSNFDAGKAKIASALVAHVAAQKIEKEAVEEYEPKELEIKIHELDSFLEGNLFVERANKGDLSSAELVEFRKALALRVRYFEQKANYLLNET